MEGDSDYGVRRSINPIDSDYGVRRSINSIDLDVWHNQLRENGFVLCPIGGCGIMFHKSCDLEHHYVNCSGKLRSSTVECVICNALLSSSEQSQVHNSVLHNGPSPAPPVHHGTNATSLKETPSVQTTFHQNSVSKNIPQQLPQFSGDDQHVAHTVYDYNKMRPKYTSQPGRHVMQVKNKGSYWNDVESDSSSSNNSCEDGQIVDRNTFLKPFKLKRRSKTTTQNYFIKNERLLEEVKFQPIRQVDRSVDVTNEHEGNMPENRSKLNRIGSDSTSHIYTPDQTSDSTLLNIYTSDRTSYNKISFTERDQQTPGPDLSWNNPSPQNQQTPGPGPSWNNNSPQNQQTPGPGPSWNNPSSQNQQTPGPSWINLGPQDQQTRGLSRINPSPQDQQTPDPYRINPSPQSNHFFVPVNNSQIYDLSNMSQCNTKLLPINLKDENSSGSIYIVTNPDDPADNKFFGRRPRETFKRVRNLNDSVTAEKISSRRFVGGRRLLSTPLSNVNTSYNNVESDESYLYKTESELEFPRHTQRKYKNSFSNSVPDVQTDFIQKGSRHNFKMTGKNYTKRNHPAGIFPVYHQTSNNVVPDSRFIQSDMKFKSFNEMHYKKGLNAERMVKESSSLPKFVTERKESPPVPEFVMMKKLYLAEKAQQLRKAEKAVAQQEQEAQERTWLALKEHEAVLKEVEESIKQREVLAQQKYEKASRLIEESRKITKSNKVKKKSFLINAKPSLLETSTHRNLSISSIVLPEQGQVQLSNHMPSTFSNDTTDLFVHDGLSFSSPHKNPEMCIFQEEKQLPSNNVCTVADLKGRKPLQKCAFGIGNIFSTVEPTKIVQTYSHTSEKEVCKQTFTPPFTQSKNVSGALETNLIDYSLSNSHGKERNLINESGDTVTFKQLPKFYKPIRPYRPSRPIRPYSAMPHLNYLCAEGESEVNETTVDYSWPSRAEVNVDSSWPSRADVNVDSTWPSRVEVKCSSHSSPDDLSASVAEKVKKLTSTTYTKVPNPKLKSEVSNNLYQENASHFVNLSVPPNNSHLFEFVHNDYIVKLPDVQPDISPQISSNRLSKKGGNGRLLSMVTIKGLSFPGKYDNSILGKCDNSIPGKCDNSILGKCDNSIPGKCDNSILGKCDNSILGKCDNSILGKCDNSIPGKCDNSILRKYNNLVPEKCDNSVPEKCSGKCDNSVPGKCVNSIPGICGNSFPGKCDNSVPQNVFELHNTTNCIKKDNRDVKLEKPILLSNTRSKENIENEFYIYSDSSKRGVFIPNQGDITSRNFLSVKSTKNEFPVNDNFTGNEALVIPLLGEKSVTSNSEISSHYTTSKGKLNKYNSYPLRTICCKNVTGLDENKIYKGIDGALCLTYAKENSGRSPLKIPIWYNKVLPDSHVTGMTTEAEVPSGAIKPTLNNATTNPTCNVLDSQANYSVQSNTCTSPIGKEAWCNYNAEETILPYKSTPVKNGKVSSKMQNIVQDLEELSPRPLLVSESGVLGSESGILVSKSGVLGSELGLLVSESGVLGSESCLLASELGRFGPQNSEFNTEISNVNKVVNNVYYEDRKMLTHNDKIPEAVRSNPQRIDVVNNCSQFNVSDHTVNNNYTSFDISVTDQVQNISYSEKLSKKDVRTNVFDMSGIKIPEDKGRMNFKDVPCPKYANVKTCQTENTCNKSPVLNLDGSPIPSTLGSKISTVLPIQLNSGINCLLPCDSLQLNKKFDMTSRYLTDQLTVASSMKSVEEYIDFQPGNYSNPFIEREMENLNEDIPFIAKEMEGLNEDIPFIAKEMEDLNVDNSLSIAREIEALNEDNSLSIAKEIEDLNEDNSLSIVREIEDLNEDDSLSIAREIEDLNEYNSLSIAREIKDLNENNSLSIEIEIEDLNEDSSFSIAIEIEDLNEENSLSIVREIEDLNEGNFLPIAREIEDLNEDNSLSIAREIEDLNEDSSLSIVREIEDLNEENSLSIVREIEDLNEGNSLPIAREIEDLNEDNSLSIAREIKDLNECNSLSIAREIEDLNEDNSLSIVREIEDLNEGNSLPIAREIEDLNEDNSLSIAREIEDLNECNSLSIAREIEDRNEDNSLSIVREIEDLNEGNSLPIAREIEDLNEDNSLSIAREIEDLNECNSLSIAREIEDLNEDNSLSIVKEIEDLNEDNSLSIAREIEDLNEENSLPIAREIEDLNEDNSLSIAREIEDLNEENSLSIVSKMKDLNEDTPHVILPDIATSSSSINGMNGIPPMNATKTNITSIANLKYDQQLLQDFLNDSSSCDQAIYYTPSIPTNQPQNSIPCASTNTISCYEMDGEPQIIHNLSSDSHINAEMQADEIKKMGLENSAKRSHYVGKNLCKMEEKSEDEAQIEKVSSMFQSELKRGMANKKKENANLVKSFKVVSIVDNNSEVSLIDTSSSNNIDNMTNTDELEDGGFYPSGCLNNSQFLQDTSFGSDSLLSRSGSPPVLNKHSDLNESYKVQKCSDLNQTLPNVSSNSNVIIVKSDFIECPNNVSPKSNVINDKNVFMKDYINSSKNSVINDKTECMEDSNNASVISNVIHDKNYCIEDPKHSSPNSEVICDKKKYMEDLNDASLNSNLINDQNDFMEDPNIASSNSNAIKAKNEYMEFSNNASPILNVINNKSCYMGNSVIESLNIENENVNSVIESLNIENENVNSVIESLNIENENVKSQGRRKLPKRGCVTVIVKTEKKQSTKIVVSPDQPSSTPITKRKLEKSPQIRHSGRKKAKWIQEEAATVETELAPSVPQVLGNFESIPSTPQVLENFECGKCESKFTIEEEFNQHINSSHSGMARLKGESQEFDSASAFLRMKEAFKQEKILSCNLCRKQFKSLLGFQFHYEICGKSYSEKYVDCEICNKAVHKRTFKNHMKSHNNDDVRKNKGAIDSAKIKDRKPRIYAGCFTQINKLYKADSERESGDNLHKINDDIKRLYFTKVPLKVDQYAVLAQFKKTLEEIGSAPCANIGCKMSLKSMKELYIHDKSCSKAQRYFLCKICQHTTPILLDILSHITTNHSDCLSKNINSGTNDLKNSKNKTFQPPITLTRPNCSSKKLNREFRERNFSDNLFGKFFTRLTDWSNVEERNVDSYYPVIEISPSYKSFNVSSKNNTESWERLERFSGKEFDLGKICFTGGPIRAAAWCPIPDNYTNSDQYIALACLSDPDILYPIDKAVHHKGLIQIWNWGKLNECSSPSLSLKIAHEFGLIWSLEWCPSGIYEDFGNESLSNSNLGRLGLLAAACSDGTIRVYVIPHPHQIERNSEVFNKTPDITLCPYNSDELDIQCVKVSWCSSRGHSLIAGSFTNGMVCVWDLNSCSKILMVTDALGNTLLYPISSIPAHHGVCTTVSFCPQTDGKHIVTGGTDRIIKFWDRTQPDQPLKTFDKVMVTDSVWLPHWTGAVVSFDVGGHEPTPSTFYGNGFFGSTNRPVLVSNAAVWNIAGSDWLNAVAQVDDAGEVVVSSKHPMLCEISSEKHISQKWFPVFSVKLQNLNDGQELSFEDQYPSKEGCQLKKNIGKEVANEKTSSENSNFGTYKFIDHPLTFSLAAKNYGVTFCDEDYNNNFRILKPQVVHSRQCAEITKPGPILIYPLMGANSVAWNNNKGSHTWIFVGLNSGFGRIINLKMFDEM